MYRGPSASANGGAPSFNPNAILAQLRAKEGGPPPSHASHDASHASHASHGAGEHDHGAAVDASAAPMDFHTPYLATGFSDPVPRPESMHDPHLSYPPQPPQPSAAAMHGTDPFPSAPAWQFAVGPSHAMAEAAPSAAGTAKELEERLRATEDELELALARNSQQAQEHERKEREWREKECDFASTLRVLRTRISELEAAASSKPTEVHITWNDMETAPPVAERHGNGYTNGDNAAAVPVAMPPPQTQAPPAAPPMPAHPPAPVSEHRRGLPTTGSQMRTPTQNVSVDLSSLSLAGGGSTPGGRRQSRLYNQTKSSVNRDRRASATDGEQSMANGLHMYLRAGSGSGKETPKTTRNKPAFTPAGRSNRRGSAQPLTKTAIADLY